VKKKEAGVEKAGTEYAVQSQMRRFRKLMKAGGDRERAVFEKAYLKSPYKFFGTSLPFAEKTAKEFWKRNREAGRDYILALVEALFASEYHDEKRLGLRLLQFYPAHLGLSVMPMLENMLKRSPTWDLVDDISIHLVGAVQEEEGI
jgi:hypothetical protein